MRASLCCFDGIFLMGFGLARSWSFMILVVRKASIETNFPTALILLRQLPMLLAFFKHNAPFPLALPYKSYGSPLFNIGCLGPTDAFCTVSRWRIIVQPSTVITLASWVKLLQWQSPLSLVLLTKVKSTTKVQSVEGQTLKVVQQNGLLNCWTASVQKTSRKSVIPQLSIWRLIWCIQIHTEWYLLVLRSWIDLALVI